MYDVHSLGQAEIALYFHLLEICDMCSWVNPFKRQNTKICSHLGMSKKTLERTRNRLQQATLIKISGTGKGSTNISYYLEKGTKKVIIYPSNDTSKGPSLATSDGSINKEEELKEEIIKEYTRDENFENEILKFFGFNQLGEHFEQQKKIKECCAAQFSSGRLEFFKSQFRSYRDWIALIGAGYKHGFDRFLGRQDEGFKDGSWQSENWRMKISERTARNGQQVNAGQQTESRTTAAQRRHEESLKKFKTNGT